MARPLPQSQSLPTAPTVVPTKIKLKLLVDNGNTRVIYAEAGKDFVDFLFSLLSLQVSSMVRVLTKDNMVGYLGELYGSLESFNSAYWLTNVDKGQILKPLPPSDYVTVQQTLAMLRYDGLPSGAGTGGTGYVKGGEAVYMVTDDLVVTPLETSSIVKVLKNVNNGNLLEERSIEFGTEEGLKLIRASFGSRTVLTDLFTKKGGPQQPSPFSYETRCSLPCIS